MHPLAHVDTPSARSGVVVRVPARDAELVAGELAARGIHVSIADAGRAPGRTRHREVRSLSDELLPEVPGSAPVRWLRTRASLHAQARALGLRHSFYYLQPSGGLAVGQLVLARTDRRDARSAARCGSAPRAAASAPGARGRRGGRRASTARPRSVLGLERIVSWLGSYGLRAEPLEKLMRSPFHQRQQQRRAHEHHRARGQQRERGRPAVSRRAACRRSARRTAAARARRARSSGSRTRPVRPGSPGAPAARSSR